MTGQTVRRHAKCRHTHVRRILRGDGLSTPNGMSLAELCVACNDGHKDDMTTIRLCYEFAATVKARL